MSHHQTDFWGFCVHESNEVTTKRWMSSTVTISLPIHSDSQEALAGHGPWKPTYTAPLFSGSFLGGKPGKSIVLRSFGQSRSHIPRHPGFSAASRIFVWLTGCAGHFWPAQKEKKKKWCSKKSLCQWAACWSSLGLDPCFGTCPHTYPQKHKQPPGWWCE